MALNLLELVEDLEPHKRVENQRLKFLLVMLRVIIPKEFLAAKIQDESNGKLADSLANDHLEHSQGDERGRLSIRLSVQNAPGRRIRSQSQSSKCVHDEVDPEQLHSVEYGFTFSVGNGRDESQHHSGDVYSELELQECRLVTGYGFHLDY